MQTHESPIGGVIDGIRDALSWLGKCSRARSQHSMHLAFRFAPETGGGTLKLKVEINTREHQSLLGLKGYPFEIESDWHQAKVEIESFEPEELFGTKLRALLQRDKHRDLFDLREGLLQLGLDRDKLLASFHHYLAMEGNTISRANAEEQMLKKLSRNLAEDIAPLLPAGVNFDNAAAIEAFRLVWVELIQRMPGDPWKSTKSVIEAIRRTKIPNLLDGV